MNETCQFDEKIYEVGFKRFYTIVKNENTFCVNLSQAYETSNQDFDFNF
jgi:hypothetical protein